MVMESTYYINNYDHKLISSHPTDIITTATFPSDTVETSEKVPTAVRNIFFVKRDSHWLKRINYFGKSLVLVNALIVAIIISIATMIILLIIILLNRKRMEKEELLHQYLLEKYQSLIINYLFGYVSPEEFRSIASDTYRRQVLIDQMIDVSINLKGEESNKLQSLYKLLSLDRDSISKAYNHRWHKKIKGFRELAYMNIKDANVAIYKALNSSNEILRMEAQIALVRLSDDDPFEFLSHLTSHFSLWEQITLHELIIQHNIPVPSFNKWLTSPNPTVVIFALRMIREFKQIESEDNVRETLMHPDPAVRCLAVQVAGDLDMHSTLEPMKHMYKNQEYKICLEIIKSMGKMPDISMMGFLKLVLDKEQDVQLQIEATKAIRNNGEEGDKALAKLMESEYKNYNIIIKHVLDRRIF
jgi:HEAT repeat protein